MIIQCKQCNKEFKSRSWGKRSKKFCSYGCYWETLKGNMPKKPIHETVARLGAWNRGLEIPENRGKNHFAWKGDKVGYFALHSWVRRTLGTPCRCENCGRANLRRRQYHWSNISGNYKRLISDWQRLCVKCHKAFDMSRA